MMTLINIEQSHQIETVLRRAERRMPSGSNRGSVPAQLRHLPLSVQRMHGFRPDTENFDVGRMILQGGAARQFTEDLDRPHNAALMVFALANQIARENDPISRVEQDVRSWGRMRSNGVRQVQTGFSYALRWLMIERSKAQRSGKPAS